jgi:hypothetical protein
MFDNPVVDDSILIAALTDFIKFFRDIEILMRRRRVLERSRQDGLILPLDFRETYPPFKAGSAVHNLMIGAGDREVKINYWRKNDRCRMAILFYVGAATLEYQDSPSRMEGFLKRLIDLARKHSNQAGRAELFLRKLLELVNSIQTEEVKRVMFMSRMMLLANRIERGH